MSNSTYLPIVTTMPVASPVDNDTAVVPVARPVSEQPTSIGPMSEPFASETLQPMPIVPTPMALCRSCNQSFLRHEGDRGSARYYRCRDCVSTEALMISMAYSCNVS